IISTCMIFSRCHPTSFPPSARRCGVHMRIKGALFLIPVLATALLAGCSQTSTTPASHTDGGVNTEAPLYDQLPDAVKDAGVIKIAGDTHPPYRTIEENGDITGIDPDLQAALSKQLGVPFEII